jgi:hypothetical protein
MAKGDGGYLFINSPIRLADGVGPIRVLHLGASMDSVILIIFEKVGNASTKSDGGQFLVSVAYGC